MTAFEARSGTSNLRDAFEAGRDAARAAQGTRGAGKLALVFADVFMDHERVLRGVEDVLGQTSVFGASAYAQVCSDGFQEGGVAVTLLDGSFRFATAGEPFAASPSETADALARKCLRELDGERVDLALVFCSAEAGHGSEVVAAVKEAVGGETLLFGGGAGSRELPDGTSGPSFQYAGGRITENGVALLLLSLASPDLEIATAVSHGLQPISNPIPITRAEGHYVYEIDGEDVFSFYEKYLGQSLEDVGNLIRTYPFLVSVPGQEHTLVRVPAFVEREKGRIGFFPTDSMQDQTVSLAHFSRNGIVGAARETAYNAKVQLGDCEPRLMLAVSCGARLTYLGGRAGEEAEALFEIFGRVPLAGLYSGAEVVPRSADCGEEEDLPSCSDSHLVAATFCLLVIGDRSGASDSSALEVDRTWLSCDLPLTLEEQLARAHGRIAELTERTAQSDRLLDVREQVLLKINKENIEISSELRNANLRLSELNQRNQRLQGIIKQYTPRSTWNKAGKLAGEEGLAIPDESADLAYMFLDVKGFTPYSETHTPEEVIDALNGILGPATDIIYENSGDVQKYIGDAIFATFEQPEDAVEAALSICRAVARIETAFKIRVGLHAGRSVAGNVGSDLRRDNTMIGDAVNLAQRLESACAPGGVLLSRALLDRVSGKLRLEGKLKEITVKGKAQAIEVFEVDVEASAYNR